MTQEDKSKLINSIIKAYKAALAYNTEDANHYYDWLTDRSLNFGICHWVYWIYSITNYGFEISELKTWFKEDFIKNFIQPSVGAYLCAHPENIVKESKLFPDQYTNEIMIMNFKKTLQQRLDRLLEMKEFYNL